jgi:hypothetical protein
MSVMNLSGVVTSLASHTALAVKRAVAGAYVNGRYVASAPAGLTVLASVQPLTGDDLLVLPEGERTTGAIEIFSVVELLPTQEALNKLGDLVTYLGKDYRVRNVQNWDPNGAYWRSVAVEVGQ